MLRIYFIPVFPFGEEGEVNSSLRGSKTTEAISFTLHFRLMCLGDSASCVECLNGKLMR